MNQHINEVFFSPGGTTKDISSMICKAAGWKNTNKIDLLNKKNKKEQSFTSEEIVVFAMPVFAGRIPEIASKQLMALKGNNTSALAIVVYGNRDYEDALLELTEILTKNGFTLFGAAAFIARHSIFPQVAQNRPDELDKAMIQGFAEQCSENIRIGNIRNIHVKGSNPYRDYAAPLPIHPIGKSTCTNCGLCAKICPVDAIDENKPRKTNKKKCISCTACIYACPSHARHFNGFPYKIANYKFKKRYAAYKKPDLFISSPNGDQELNHI